jgi:hypothetical protein
LSQRGGTRIAWLWWLASTALLAAALAAALFVTETASETPWLAQVRKAFLPGATTSGHHQIELACESCHTNGFAESDAMQAACVGCHGAELTAADDKHPLSKFTDPRNAELLASIDATQCVTCHVEHRPEITAPMAVTQPGDYCVLCHRDIATERPSHEGMAFDTCASSGCHNFHDNRALYEDFLVRHAAAPAQLPRQLRPRSRFAETAALLPTYPSERYPLAALDATRHDAPAEWAAAEALDDWLGTAHANAGVNCSGCHADPATTAWIAAPPAEACQTCHALESTSFELGKHGMRRAAGLPAMTPAQARLPMRAAAADTPLGCTTCHGAHAFSVREAAVDACLACHADGHSLAYRASPHAELWQREIDGQAPEGSGVSCATCHLPRVEHRYQEYDFKTWFVQHNQNDTLRPSEKMIRPVCQSCHGLSFALDALADAELVERNFTGMPSLHLQSIDMAVARERAAEDR